MSVSPSPPTPGPGSGIDAIPPHDRPLERLSARGAAALRDGELLSLIVRNGRPGRSALAVADDLLHRAGSLGALFRWTEADFRSVPGVGTVKAAQLLTVAELARRMISHQAGDEAPVLDRPSAIVRLLHPLAAGIEVEKFWVLALNRKNRLIRHFEVSSGTACSAIVHPREVFRPAIRHGAVAIACAHNHPSGDPLPSNADIQSTRALRDSARILQIDFIDHVILGSPGADPRGLGYYSFRESGTL